MHDNDELELLETVEPEIVDEPLEQDEPPKDEEKEEFSRRVNKRIDKLVYERNIAREQNAKLMQRLEALEQSRQQEAEERNQRALESKRQEALQRKVDAMEIGDHAAAAEADAELFQVIAEEKTRRTQPAPQPRQAETQVNPAYDAWHEANPWVYDQAHKARYTTANTIFHELIQEGYEAHDPDLYEELDTRLAKLDKPRQAPPPTGAPDRGQATGVQSKTFTAQDKAKMRDWGLDPDNEAHRKEWIRNKR